MKNYFLLLFLSFTLYSMEPSESSLELTPKQKQDFEDAYKASKAQVKADQKLHNQESKKLDSILGKLLVVKDLKTSRVKIASGKSGLCRHCEGGQ